MTEKTSVEAMSYHVTCYRQFTTNDIYIKRAITRLSKSDNNDGTSSSSFSASVPKSRRLSRSAVPTYDPEKRIFCQTTLNERLHECMQDSRDEELKQALADCPRHSIFSVYGLSEHAMLERVTKYHNSCWTLNITRRVPDYLSSPNTCQYFQSR